jgi:hypothetical protein
MGRVLLQVQRHMLMCEPLGRFELVLGAAARGPVADAETLLRQIRCNSLSRPRRSLPGMIRLHT